MTSWYKHSGAHSIIYFVNIIFQFRVSIVTPCVQVQVWADSCDLYCQCACTISLHSVPAWVISPAWESAFLNSLSIEYSWRLVDFVKLMNDYGDQNNANGDDDDDDDTKGWIQMSHCIIYKCFALINFRNLWLTPLFKCWELKSFLSIFLNRLIFLFISLSLLNQVTINLFFKQHTREANLHRQESCPLNPRGVFRNQITFCTRAVR